MQILDLREVNSFILSEPQLSHLWNGDANAYFRGLVVKIKLDIFCRLQS